MIEWVVAASVLRARVAVPELSVLVPITLDPLLKVTVPVGEPLAAVTVAVKVTDDPYT